MQHWKTPVAAGELLPTAGQASVRSWDMGTAALYLAGLKVMYGGWKVDTGNQITHS